MKLKVIIPNSGMTEGELHDREKMLQTALPSETRISVSCISGGPREIASHTDEYLAGSYILEDALQAEKDGFDAVIVYCFSDPAVEMLREQLEIPVIGPGEISLAIAGILGENCAVVTTVTDNIGRITGRIRKDASIREKITAVLALDISVLELRRDPEITGKRLEEICKEAIEQHHIDTLILGCLGMAQYGKILEEKYNILVIDPALTGVAFADMCVRLGIKGSRRKYQKKSIQR